AGEFLVAEPHDILAIDRNGTGKSEKTPAGFVAIASIDWVRKHSFHHSLIHRGPEDARRQSGVEDEFAGGQRNEHFLPLPLVDEGEALAVGFATMRIGRFDAGAIKLRRGERQLIALAWRPQFPRALHVETLALAPGARERTIDIDVDADIGPLRAELVRRYHMIDERLDEGRFGEIEKRIALGGGCRARLFSLRALGQMRRRCGCHCRAAGDCTFDEIATVKILVTHVGVPSQHCIRMPVSRRPANTVRLRGYAGRPWAATAQSRPMSPPTHRADRACRSCSAPTR